VRWSFLFIPSFACGPFPKCLELFMIQNATGVSTKKKN